jgi:hypothetical protein
MTIKHNQQIQKNRKLNILLSLVSLCRSCRRNRHRDTIHSMLTNAQISERTGNATCGFTSIRYGYSHCQFIDSRGAYLVATFGELYELVLTKLQYSPAANHADVQHVSRRLQSSHPAPPTSYDLSFAAQPSSTTAVSGLDVVSLSLNSR